MSHEGGEVSFLVKNDMFSRKNGPVSGAEITTKLVENYEKTSRGGRPRKYQHRSEGDHVYYEKKKQRPHFPPLPSGPYRILYADPPWRYENDGLKKYGHASFHYPTLSVEELCNLRIKQIAEKNAVLFLWVTAPMLFACVPIVTAWGFQYKTHMVWDKGRHNFGHYVGVQTENLLICVRGTCRPDIHELPPNLRRIPRTQHSAKPEEFRVVIDTLYPEGKRLEMFARCKVAGWDSWGNEAVVNEEAYNGASGTPARDS